MIPPGAFEMAKRICPPRPPTYLQEYNIIAKDMVTYPQNWQDPYIRQPTVGEQPKVVIQPIGFKVNPNFGGTSVPRLYPRPVLSQTIKVNENPRDWRK